MATPPIYISKSHIIKAYTHAIIIIIRYVHVHAGLIFNVGITANHILLLMLIVDCTKALNGSVCFVAHTGTWCLADEIAENC